MPEIMNESDPTVLRFLPARQSRPWEVGVMKSTDCNADMVRPQIGFPKHCRSACRAEMHLDLSTLLPVAYIDFGRSLGPNMFPLENGTDAEHRARPPLTLATVAGGYGIGIGGHFDPQGTAAAMRGFRHRTPPLCRCIETTGGWLSERPLRGRWSALSVVVHPGRHTEPRMHRFLKDRVVGRRKCRCVECAHRDPADR